MVKTHVFTEAESLEIYKFRKEGKTFDKKGLTSRRSI